MAKESGLGWTTMEVDDSGGTARDIKNDITNLDFATPRNVQESTGLDKSAIERILLLADFSATYAGVFNDAAAPSAHDTFKTVPSSSVTRTLNHVISGQTLAVEALLTDYALSRAASGELTFSVPAVLQSGAAPTWS